MNQQDIQNVARVLLEARASGQPLQPEASEPAPRSTEDAYAVHAELMRELGEIGGWKIGAPSAQADSMYAPLPAAGLHASPARLPASTHPLRGIEVEVAFILGSDLPARPKPYALEEIVAAVHSVVPVIEEVESRLRDRGQAGPMWALADLQSHGALISGTPIPGWLGLKTESLHVRLCFDDAVIIDRECHNRGGDPLVQLQRLANSVGPRYGGLKAGQIVTTGSLTGLDTAPAGARVRAELEGLGEVSLSFE